MIEVRFDDLKSQPAKAFRFADLRETIEARTPADVPEALAALEKATQDGHWAAGYLAYEAAPGIDPDLAVRSFRDARDPFAELPLVWFGVFDRRQDVPPLSPPNASYSVSRWTPSVPRPVYEAEVERIRDSIKAGETYQVNHTMRLRGRFSGTDRAFYTALCLAQRGGHCAYIDTGTYRILSASPELFFSVDDDSLVTRPMKGTARRGRWREEDDAQAADLLASAKERAENAMIVDLLRNDMGRISEPGSVQPVRAVRNRVATHVDRPEPAAAGCRHRPGSADALSEWIGDRRAENSLDGNHRGTRRLSSWRLHGSDRLDRTPGSHGGIQRRDKDGGARPRNRGGRVRRRGRHHA
jgi:anthranilate/para-aminobenzoate synthase component I